jgi:hypothetical protein
VSRRHLLRTVAGGAASLGVAALGGAIVAHTQASPARADGEAITVGGTFTDATVLTTIENRANNTSVLVGRSKGSGTGIVGDSLNGFGGYFVSQSNNGVVGVSTGISSKGIGVHGIGSGPAVGVQGETASGRGVEGRATEGTGVRGSSTSGPGVSGDSVRNAGVIASSRDKAGVDAVSERSHAIVGSTNGYATAGVFGQTNSPNGAGIRGYAWDGPNFANAYGTGVIGTAGSHDTPPAVRSNTGVMGVGEGGRGGVFIGDDAQVQLVAATAATHPTFGLRGDLFVDKSGRLWFCKGGGTWKQLA